MMHQDSLEPAAIRFTLERLQESARRSVFAIMQPWYSMLLVFLFFIITIVKRADR